MATPWPYPPKNITPPFQPYHTQPPQWGNPSLGWMPQVAQPPALMPPSQ